MYDWELVDAYARFHPRWFESPARYEPTDEHRAAFHALAPANWSLRRSGLWFVASAPGAPLPEQGWKLHVSVRTEHAVACLRRALPCLFDEATTFKFLVDQQTVAATNGKLWPRSSSGKFITAYPRDERTFHRLGRRLSEELSELTGPHVLSDRPWPGSSCVFYRYGGFTGRSVLTAEGTRRFVLTAPDGTLTPDRREPFWSPPAWASDPFGHGDAGAGAEHLALDGGRFVVQSALRFSNRGGVYRAKDVRTGRDVVLKEARPHVQLGRHRVEATDVLRKEHRLLTQLADTTHFVRPVSMFTEAGHVFLAEELVEGDELGRFTIRHNPLYHGGGTDEFDRYYEDVRRLWADLARAVSSAHDRGIVLGDLSFGNVMVTDGGRIRIVDLECGIEEGVDPHVGLFTPGMARPSTLRSGNSGRADDLFALGSIIFGSVMLASGIAGFHPPARARFLRDLAVDLSLSSAFCELVQDLTGPEPPQGDAAVHAIETVTIRSRPPRRRRPPVRGARIRRLAEQTRDGVARYLERTADPSREDRLFPGDLLVFETNPLGVAFGACGVLYALERISGDAPDHLLDWVLRREVRSDRFPPGLYVGQAGIAWVLHVLGRRDAAVSIMRRARDHELLLDGPDVFHGASGYGLACLKLWAGGLGEELLEEAVRVGDHLRSRATWDERGACWARDDGVVPLGYAFGGSGVALFLLYLHQATGDPLPLELGRAALGFELDQGVWRGGRFTGFPAYALDDESAVVPRCYWDAGTAGVVTTLVRYLAVAPDAELERNLIPLARDVCRKYVVFPQMLHGLAGLGNAVLDVWDHDPSPRWLREAWRVCEGVLLFRIEAGDAVAFPGEQNARESADLATGAAGVGLFLDRLLAAEDGIHASYDLVVDELLPRRPVHAGVGDGLDRSDTR